jgi:energy-converting hydrogenase A subunit M
METKKLENSRKEIRMHMCKTFASFKYTHDMVYSINDLFSISSPHMIDIMVEDIEYTRGIFGAFVLMKEEGLI